MEPYHRLILDLPKDVLEVTLEKDRPRLAVHVPNASESHWTLLLLLRDPVRVARCDCHERSNHHFRCGPDRLQPRSQKTDALRRQAGFEMCWKTTPLRGSHKD